ncbi:GNA1162 family protein [Nitrosomonas sp.]|uniref:GNA1162 family protein n=1 Tax=Nitrosomonas sp. TaxID=42353 RepID=UPI00374DB6B9
MKLPIFLIICVLTITGCATLPGESSSGYAKQSDVVVVESSQELKSNPLSCVAVFPLTAKKNDLKGAELIRKELHAHLAPTGIRLVTLQRVDAAIKMTDNSLDDLNAHVAKSIGCDTIMVGEITEKSSRYYGVYSEVRAGANIQIIRASTGDVLWQGSHTAVIRGGGIPFGIGSFVMNSVFAGMNLYGDQGVWVVQDLARRIVLAIPDLVYQGED